MFPIISKVSHCSDCYRCLRNCNVKAISFSTGQAKIITEKCVLCGRCIMECPQHTKSVRDEVSKLENLLSKGPVVLSLAPTFLTYFNQWQPEQLKAKLKGLGFLEVEESAGYSMAIHRAYEEKLQGGAGYYISSHCPVVVNLVEQYFPELIAHLLPVQGVATLHGLALKNRFGSDVKVVHATACLGEMDNEANRSGVDLVIPFGQLNEYLIKQDLPRAAEDDGPPYRLVGQSLAISSGLGDWLVEEGVLQGSVVQAYSGLKDCYDILQGLAKGNVSGVSFIELMACRGGCISGIGLENRGSLLEKRAHLMERFEQYHHKPLNKMAEITDAQLYRAFTNRLYVPKPAETKAVREVLAELRQYSNKKVLNCGACGFDTCYEKAVAVVRGDAEQEMCISYMKSKAESTAHTIVRSNPNAIIVFDQDFIICEFNNAAREMFSAYGLRVGNAMFEYMDIRYFEKVVQTGMGIRDKVVQYPDLDLWTRQIIVQMYDTKNLYLAIFTDITEHEKKKLEVEKFQEETLAKASQVINNQMLVAQQIAGLLGETTADTKIALLDLIKQFSREKELE